MRGLFGERLLLLMLTVLFSLSMASGMLLACSSNSVSKTEEMDVLDIGLAFPENDWRSAYLQDFAAEIEEKSGGELKTKLHYMDEYPDMTNALEEVSKPTGKLDIALTADAYMADLSMPDLYVSGLPYMFEDFEDAWAFAESDVNAEIEGQLPQYNMHVLAHFCGGFRNIGAGEPIRYPSDLNGEIVATVKSPVLMDMLSMLGAEPQASVAGELPEALSKGTYTAVEISVPTYWRDGDYKYVPYLSITNHAYNLWSLIIDEGVWQKLSPENQKIIKEAAEKYAALEREGSKKNTEDIIRQLEEAGVTVVYPNYEIFKDATEDTRKKHSKAYPETYAKVREFLDSLQ